MLSIAKMYQSQILKARHGEGTFAQQSATPGTEPQTKTSRESVYVSPGMPRLHLGESRAVSFFEFWPTWLMYLPVVMQWLMLAIRHRSLTLPLIANPNLPISGLVGVPKSHLFSQARDECAAAILPWFTYSVTTESPSDQTQSLLRLLETHGLEFPVVCKPDIGCRGSGVKLVNNEHQLAACVQTYPGGSSLLVQRLASWEPEAGVFYVREPEQERGEIISLALKYMPYVVGDGQSTLSQLIDRDRRASQLQHLYQVRHLEHWHKIIPEGQPYRLVFSASHCRGAIFRDGNDLITEALTTKIDALMKSIPEFYYGRLDIKFPDVGSLQNGKDIEIVEINAASSESLHIWDKNTPYKSAIGALLKQYKILFELGRQNRRRGHNPPALKNLWKHWRLERHLTNYHPETD